MLYRTLFRIYYYDQNGLYIFVIEIDISAKLHVSEYSLFYRALLQKRPMILESAKLYISCGRFRVAKIHKMPFFFFFAT